VYIYELFWLMVYIYIYIERERERERELILIKVVTLHYPNMMDNNDIQYLN
jgi:hypothetical protein